MHPMVEMRDVWTFEDVDALDVPDWWRYEIVDGGLVVSPSTGGDHELASAELRTAMHGALPGGTIVAGPMGVQMTRSYLVPDLVVVERERLRGARTLAATDVMLAIEIVSPGSVTMDRVTKPAKYAAAGIKAYWRVETDPLSVTAYTLAPGAEVYTEVGSWGPSEIARIAEPFPVEFEVDRLG
jgi:Uma2 family endonuclease